MAKRKKPENETPEEASIRQVLETASDFATRSEKVSWDRKMDNMVSLLAKLKPIEEKILDLMSTKTTIVDEIASLRAEMVRDCVHPFTMLTYNTDHTANCKFCGKRFFVNSNGDSKL